MIRPEFLGGLLSQILNAAILPPGWTCFFKGMTQQAGQAVLFQGIDLVG
jgi:hypothetical protein